MIFLANKSSVFLSLILTSSLALAVNDQTFDHSELVRNTERVLKLAQPEFEKAIGKLSSQEKLALKKIAFNKEADLQIRWKALVLGARLLGKDMQSDIVQASNSNEWFMRSASMMAASELSPQDAAQMARKLIKDKALVVRSAAVDVLGASSEASDRQLLWNVIRDPINMRKGQSLWVRSQALQFLAKKPHKKETARFIEMLKESDLELQAIAIQGLEKTSDFQFGTSNESIQDHKQRWLNWWEMSGKTKAL